MPWDLCVNKTVYMMVEGLVCTKCSQMLSVIILISKDKVTRLRSKKPT